MQFHIARVLAKSNSINEAAAQVLKKICETSGWDFGALWRMDPDRLTLTNDGIWHADTVHLSEYAEATRMTSLEGDGSSLPGMVFHTGQPLWISDLDEFQFQDAVDARKAGIRSALLLPVHSGDKVIAILECLSTRRQIQNPNLAAMLNSISSQIGIFIERKLLEEALATRANQQQLLAQASMALSASIQVEQRIANIVHLIVPGLADGCVIDLLEPNNILRRVAAAHVDPSKEGQVFHIPAAWPVDFDQPGSAQVETLLGGKSLFFPDLPFSSVEEAIADPSQLEIMRQLNPQSVMVVPLVAHNRILGICTLFRSGPGRRYSSSDLSLAEDIVHRTALALDNAILYAESQKLNAELERRVEERTAQLVMAINQLTSQIAERQNAEQQVRTLVAELEQRIAERTSQLEVSNRNLHKEVMDHQRASQSLRVLLKRTRELYRISQMIGTVRTPNELLKLLLSSSYLKDASRASIAILDKPWQEEAPPDHCFILAEWNRGARQPRFIDRQFSLEEYGVIMPVSYGAVIVIPDMPSETKLSEAIRKRFADLNTRSLIILPLIAGGEWYGLLSLHFRTRRMNSLDDLRHVRGLVDQTAIVIKNMRLLEAESQARQEAETANDLKLKFLAMISHELRTPLTSIKGFATTLLAEDVVWPLEKQRDFLQTINKESDKLHDLIEQLLNLSRIEAGTLRISPRKLSLNHVIDSALVQLRVISPEHPLILNVPPNLPPIFSDEQRIAQVLTNLVGNAAKFSPAQTQIRISAHRSGEMIQVDVSDQGPGIPARDRTRVFEPFRQLDDSTGNRMNGAGLGLAICKGVIEAQNGRIWIQDHDGPGTVISFTLPIFVEAKKGRR